MLAPWKKSYDSILKKRHYFAKKGPSSQSYGLSSSHVWMCELDYKQRWAPKNWCFWTVVLENSWESLGHLMWRTDSLEKTLMLGKIEGRRGRQRMRWLDGITITLWMWVWVSARSWWWTGKPGVLQSMGSQRVGHDWVTELLKKILYTGIACFYCTLLHCALQMLYFLCQVYQCHSICSLHVSVLPFGNPHSNSNYSICIIFVILICNHWSFLFLPLSAPLQLTGFLFPSQGSNPCP